MSKYLDIVRQCEISEKRELSPLRVPPEGGARGVISPNSLSSPPKLRYPTTPKPTPAEVAEAIETVQRVGHCLMYSTILQQRFVICRDEDSKAWVAHDVPVFTVKELEALFSQGKRPSTSTLRLIFEAKKAARATVTDARL